MSEGSVIATSGSVFTISSQNGDMLPGTAAGLYSEDTRFLSEYKVLVNGKPTNSISVDRFDSSIVSYYCNIEQDANLPESPFSIVRDRKIGDGMHEDIFVQNHSTSPQSFNISITFEADFADVFEVRSGSIHKSGNISLLRKGKNISYEYRRDAFRREVRISVSNVPVSAQNGYSMDLKLSPKKIWKTCVSAAPSPIKGSGDTKCVSSVLESPFGKYERNSSRFLRQRAERTLLESLTLPEMQTRNASLQQAYYQSIYDLSSLELEILPKKHVLAAGIPWFMALFGRDSAISAIQSKIIGSELMVNTVETLASLQATKVDKFREAEPGKIPHEVRHGELSVFEEVPHSRYYGSVDATPLFVMLLWEAYQWTGDLQFLKKYISAGEKAIGWINNYGDLDGDGFVEYLGNGARGLRNQGWKDSEDSVSFASGELAKPPIALVEVQGYVYAAKARMADLYRALGELEKAGKISQEASKLKHSFNKAFWMPKSRFFALALDGDKKQVDAISSNVGHCLWTHVIDDDKAAIVVKRLMSDEMFTGWGIRTLSSDMARYNPLSYHNGSVWPHDNSIISAGMAAYDFVKEANEICLALIEASSAFSEHRLPELFAGYIRREHSKLVPYPMANSPQAWASGAIIYSIETLLGLSVSGNSLMQKARLEGIPLSLTGIEFRGSRVVV
jgi:glycogen debranching enzyme